MLRQIRTVEDYSNSLIESQRVRLPDNPAGLIELTNVELTDISAGECPPDPTEDEDLSPRSADHFSDEFVYES
jgi:mersacidin/lichenicidin family type 2 lantibiotic